MKQLILRLLNKINLLAALNINISTLVNDTRVIVPINNRIGLDNLNMSEIWMIQVLKTLQLNNGDTFIDIGANTGQTLIKLKSVYPEIDYIGFEPNPLCNAYINHLVKVNNWDKVNIFPVAIGENSGLVAMNFYTESETDSCASIIPGYRDADTVTKTTYCPCYKVEDISSVFDRKNIAVIKIDVEGAELEVTRELKNLINDHKPCLLVEILPVYNSNNIFRLERQQELENILKELGYYIYRIHKEDDNNFYKFEHLDSLDIHDRLEWCDYIFTQEKMDIHNS